MAFPIARGDLVNFLGFVSRPVEEGVALDRKWTAEATKQEVQGYFEGWEPAVQSLLAVRAVFSFHSATVQHAKYLLCSAWTPSYLAGTCMSWESSHSAWTVEWH